MSSRPAAPLSRQSGAAQHAGRPQDAFVQLPSAASGSARLQLPRHDDRTAELATIRDRFRGVAYHPRLRSTFDNLAAHRLQRTYPASVSLRIWQVLTAAIFLAASARYRIAPMPP